MNHHKVTYLAENPEEPLLTYPTANCLNTGPEENYQFTPEVVGEWEDVRETKCGDAVGTRLTQ